MDGREDHAVPGRGRDGDAGRPADLPTRSPALKPAARPDRDEVRARVARVGLAGRVISGIATFTVGSSVIGAGVVAVLLAFFVPLPVSETVGSRVAVLATAGGYLIFACVVGVVVGIGRNRRTLHWLVVGHRPTAAQANQALRLPVDIAVISAVLWALGAVVVGVVTASLASDARIALRVVLTIVLGGLVTSLVSYLLAGRVARPVTTLALAAHPPRSRLVLGVTPRLMLSWLLATGVPALGVLLLYADPSNLGGPTPAAVVLLVATSLVVGGLGMLLAARAVGQPLRRLRDMVERVGDGDYDVRVRVDDAGEIGLLQHRVNAMTEGLGERERLADLFGRHVGADVARRALATGVQLGGEERTVAALFVDIAGSTGLALDRGPQETVAVLNRFFQVVVDAVEEHGGFVNKFEGDAALCVFGAPVDLPDAAGRALAAARDIARAVRAAGEVDLGLGVAYGRVVAGQIGATSRLEYTVIGDAVNEAARLTEQAKHAPGRVLVAGDAVAAADPAERERWVQAETLPLRGRSADTVTFVPRDDTATPTDPVLPWAAARRELPLTGSAGAARSDGVARVRGMDKTVGSTAEAVADIGDGATLGVGGFGLCGIPFRLIDALFEQGATELRTVSNNCGVDGAGLGKLLFAGRIARTIGSYVGENKEFARQYLAGELELELCPQGTLAERLRAGGAGIPGFFTPAGVGTLVADGGLPWRYAADGSVAVASPAKETRAFPQLDGAAGELFGDREYVLEHAIVTDFALVRAAKGDRHGNLVFDKSARNFNPLVAAAGRITIAEVEELVEPGEIDGDAVHTPGIHVDRVVLVGPEGKAVERITTNPAPTAGTVTS